jgi:hypothetical protein
MTRMTGLMAVLFATGGPAAEAAAADFGNVSLNPGETQRISTGSGRGLHVCNNFESAGTIDVVISSHAPQKLPPGLCLDDIGDVIVATNQGGGPATLTYKVKSRSRAGRG